MLEFGDVIYRPCLSYAGKKNFINTQIVLEIIIKDNKDYIRSVDFIGQKWTDSLNDLGGTIFVDKNKAKQKLGHMIAEKEKNMDNKCCLFCRRSMSGDAPDGTDVLVCFECEGHEGKEMIVGEDECCGNFD